MKSEEWKRSKRTDKRREEARGAGVAPKEEGSSVP